MTLVLAVVRRTFSMIVTLFGVSVIIFVVLRLLPGNAVTAAVGVSEGLLTKGQIAALDRYYGVGQPPIQQYWSWLHSLLSGNLGISLVDKPWKRFQRLGDPSPHLLHARRLRLE